MDELKRPGGAFYLPCGRLLVNKSKAPEIYYDSFLNPITLNPGESKYVQSLKTLDLSTFFLSPELWNARQALEELLKGKEKISILLDMSLVDRFGDALMLTVVPKAYKLVLEDRVQVFVLVDEKVIEAWQENPYIKGVFVAPPTSLQFDLKVDLNNVEEKWKEGTFLSEKEYANRTDVVLDNLGLALLNKTPVYVVAEEERKWAKKFVDNFATEPHPLVGMSLFSAAKCRTYPRMTEVAELIEQNVLYLDQKNSNGTFMHSFRHMAALVEQCDIIVSADSAILHLAGAMKKRIVGIFGGTGGKVFTEDYEKATVIQADCPTGTPECWWTVPCLPGTTYKEKMVAGEAPCLYELSPIDVADAIDYQLTRHRKLFILMLTYNLLEMTKKALESVRAWDDYEIFVVDNQSTDGTQEWLSNNGYRYVTLKCGVAAAINIGLRKFLTTDCNYFLLLNNDIALRADTIDELFKTQKESNAWVVMSDPKESVPPWAIDRMPKAKCGYENITEIPAGSYSCTLFTRECVEKTGLFHERFRPRYIEDNDYTLRLRALGGTFVRSFNSFYYHALGAVVKTNEIEKKTVNKDWDANVGIFQEMWGFHPHDKQNLNRLGLEWKKSLTGKNPLEEITERVEAGILPVPVTIRRGMGGWGDILFTTVIGRGLHCIFGNKVAISYLVPQQFWPVYNDLTYVRSLTHATDRDYDITDLEFRVELHESGEWGQVKTPRTKIYLQTFGLPTNNLKPDYLISEREHIEALGQWDMYKGDGKKILIVLEASNKLKTWPHMGAFINLLKQKNYRVFPLGNVPTFRQAAALVGNADIVVSPDTGLSNVAAALDIPTVTLFGHRNGAVFAEMFKTMIPVQGHCPYDKKYCDFDVPCFGGGPHRAKENKDFPECLKRLLPEEILDEVEKLL